MISSQLSRMAVAAALAVGFAGAAGAQSFRVQCPTHTALHHLVDEAGNPNPSPSDLPADATYKYPNPHIKCQQISGGDGFATMGDGTQTYLFAFGPLSGLDQMVNGLEGTVPSGTFNQDNTEISGGVVSVLDAVKQGAPYVGDGFNGAIGLVPDVEGAGSGAFLQAIVGIGPTASGVDGVDVNAPGAGYSQATAVVWIAPPPNCVINTTTCVQATATATVDGTGGISAVTVTNPGAGYASSPAVSIMGPAVLNGHVDAGLVMDVGVLNGNIPAPLIVIEEGDELFLTLTNVGQVMRPDLFEQHTVHFHGYPNASAFYDGVPDASVAINVGGSFTYYYLAPEPGTYMWHCHISPPEHLQMGMVGQIYVRPHQNRVSGSLYSSLSAANSVDLAHPDPAVETQKCTASDILCSSQTPPANNGFQAGRGFVSTDMNKSARAYAYNDGDGSTRYDVEYPLQLHGFDPNFHFVGMTFNPESFADNKDKYFLINGRSYPDTVGGYVCSGTGDALPACAGKASGTIVAGPMRTQDPDGMERSAQQMAAVINIPVGGRALLRFSDLNVTEYHTLASLGIPMHVIGYNARLLRDQAGNNTAYDTNSITIGGGESLDVILDASDTTKYRDGQKFYLYTPQLDHLSNDAENFGGMMTEVNICSSVNPTTKVCTHAPSLTASN
jgi:FtsP/CotA-like multicopper oxidase with cupredoxin domain